MRSCKRDTEVAKMGAEAAKLGKNECKVTNMICYSISLYLIFRT